METSETVILALKCSEPDCDEMMPSRDQFNRHLLYRHAKFPYACLQASCRREFQVMGELGPHVRDHHHGLKYWPCAKCDRHFPTHRGLRHHLWYYHLEGRFACPSAGCLFTASLPIIIKQHRYREHSPLYTCPHPTCGRVFKQRSNLVRHGRTHSGVKPYRCNYVPVMMAASALCGFRSAAAAASAISAAFSGKNPTGEEEDLFTECNYSSEVRSHVHRHIRCRHLKQLVIRRLQLKKVNNEGSAAVLSTILDSMDDDMEKFVIVEEAK